MPSAKSVQSRPHTEPSEQPPQHISAGHPKQQLNPQQPGPQGNQTSFATPHPSLARAASVGHRPPLGEAGNSDQNYDRNQRPVIGPNSQTREFRAVDGGENTWGRKNKKPHRPTVEKRQRIKEKHRSTQLANRTSRKPIDKIIISNIRRSLLPNRIPK